MYEVGDKRMTDTIAKTPWMGDGIPSPSETE